ncbi:MAG: hypothetical protein COA43_05610 [Robiginitomaculum sp.]|nr:MAG: hypothetical protein COA43_05610 [Robiginitomaculum sp.]
MKRKFTHQISLLATISLMTTFVPTLVSAQEYQCVTPAQSAAWVKTRQPKGNWGPQHNTRKWSYAAINGADIYRHRNGNRTIGTRCKGIGYNYGTLKVDFDGNQDWCANYRPAVSQKISSPFCDALYTLSADKQRCVRDAKPGYWRKNRVPKGNWGPQHDTRKWSYAAVSGADIFRHRNGNRTVGTRCKKGNSYNYGTHKIDLVGTQDYCAYWTQATAASVRTSRCGSDATRRIKPTDSSTGNISHGTTTVGTSTVGSISHKPSIRKKVQPMKIKKAKKMILKDAKQAPKKR